MASLAIALRASSGVMPAGIVKGRPTGSFGVASRTCARKSFGLGAVAMGWTSGRRGACDTAVSTRDAAVGPASDQSSVGFVIRAADARPCQTAVSIIPGPVAMTLRATAPAIRPAPMPAGPGL
jgi:hypothetical protein